MFLFRNKSVYLNTKTKKYKQMAFIHNHTKGDYHKTGLEVRHASGMIIANVYAHNGMNVSAKENFANAKLLAQSPKLLEFAEMLHDMYVKNEKKPFFFKELQETIEKAGVEITHK